MTSDGRQKMAAVCCSVNFIVLCSDEMHSSLAFVLSFVRLGLWKVCRHYSVDF